MNWEIFMKSGNRSVSNTGWYKQSRKRRGTDEKFHHLRFPSQPFWYECSSLTMLNGFIVKFPVPSKLAVINFLWVGKLHVAFHGFSRQSLTMLESKSMTGFLGI